LAVDPSVARRQRQARAGRIALFLSLILALVALIILVVDIANQTAGLVVYSYEVSPNSIAPGTPLEELSRDQLLALANANISDERKLQLPEDYGLSVDQMAPDELVNLLYNEVPDPFALTARPVDQWTNEDLLTILADNVTEGRLEEINAIQPLPERSREELFELVKDDVLGERVARSWRIIESIFERDRILAEIQRDYPDSAYEWKWWLTPSFIFRQITTAPETTGIRTALLGSIFMVALTLLFAVPIGVAGGIYLEEFASRNRLNQIIQTNIYNLAGVPSIIYGMLGLAIFVQALGEFTRGAAFGIANPTDNGRTLVSGALTMALLILPLIIINTQEAIRAVPESLRDGSLALGATRLQTVWSHVLPVSAPGIFTGLILSTSRAIGETAPLILVGAATYIATDPNSPFSKFTVLPIQIYNWATLPEQTWRNVSAAAIIVLLVLSIAFNLFAIVLRNRLRKSL
jgi:phosphate transport system permease protein